MNKEKSEWFKDELNRLSIEGTSVAIFVSEFYNIRGTIEIVYEDFIRVRKGEGKTMAIIKFNTNEENLYDCPNGCANMDVDDFCMRCNLGSNFKKR